MADSRDLDGAVISQLNLAAAPRSLERPGQMARPASRPAAATADN